MFRKLLWIVFIINSIGISIYLFAAALGFIIPPKNFLFCLIIYGIFTSIIFGDLILKPINGGDNKRI